MKFAAPSRREVGEMCIRDSDCTAFAYGNFHADFMKKKICLIGCPKLDEGDYTDKLTAIIQQHQIQSITAVSYTHLNPLSMPTIIMPVIAVIQLIYLHNNYITLTITVYFSNIWCYNYFIHF